MMCDGENTTTKVGFSFNTSFLVSKEAFETKGGVVNFWESWTHGSTVQGVNKVLNWYFFSSGAYKLLGPSKEWSS